MSDKKNKPTDPLLSGDDEGTGDQAGKPANVEATPAQPAAATPPITPAVETPPAVPAKPVSNTTAAKVKAEAIAKFPKDIVAQTKYILDNSEKVNFIIPKLEGEVGDETVQINGYKLTIQKNVMVNIPVQVANLLAEKYRIAMEAGKDKRIDRASDVSEALG